MTQQEQGGRIVKCPRCDGDIGEGTPFCSMCGAAIVAEPLVREAPQVVAAGVEVTQQIGTVEGGRIVGVDLGEVLGDVTIGDYTLRIGTLNGGVVSLIPPQEHRAPRMRPAPVMLLPRHLPGFLDRRDEIAAATAVLRGASPVEFHGAAGVGKTALLRHLAHHEFGPVFPDGVVFFSEIRHRPMEDLLLNLFDAFYEREAGYKPTDGQVRHALQEKQALWCSMMWTWRAMRCRR